MMNVVVPARVAEPLVEPVSVAEAQLFLRMDAPEDEALLATMITAARQIAERVLRQSLITQQWCLRFDDSSPACLRLPMSPVQEIVSVKTITAGGIETVFDEQQYTLDAAKRSLRFLNTPTGNVVEIRYLAGYGDAAEDVPAAIRRGIMQHVAQMMEGRDTLAMPAPGVLAMYHSHRELMV